MVQAVKRVQEQSLGKHRGVPRADLTGRGSKHRFHKTNRKAKEQECMPFSPEVASLLCLTEFTDYKTCKDEKSPL